MTRLAALAHDVAPAGCDHGAPAAPHRGRPDRVLPKDHPAPLWLREALGDALGTPDALARLGYELVDRWHDPSRRTAVPYRPGASPIAYTGYYLRRAPRPPAAP